MWPDGGIKNSPIIAIFTTVVFTLIGTFSKSPKNYITFDKKCFHQDLTKIAQSGHNECVSCTLLALSLEWGLFQFKLTGVGGAKLLPLVTLPLCLVHTLDVIIAGHKTMVKVLMQKPTRWSSLNRSGTRRFLQPMLQSLLKHSFYGDPFDDAFSASLGFCL